MYKAKTSIGGINAHFVFVEKPFIEKAPDWEDNEYFYFSGELASYYHDWEILCNDEKVIDCSSSGIKHCHAVNSFMAKRIK